MAPGLDAELARQLVDAPAAAVHDDRFHSDQAQQRDVARESRLERRIGHRIAAEADHQRLAVVGANVGQRLGEDAGFGIGGHGDRRRVYTLRCPGITQKQRRARRRRAR